MNVSININKAVLLQQIINELERELAQLRAGYEEARLTSIEAPGRMQSRYDTMGVEAAWVADGLAKNFEEKAEGLSRIKQFRLPNNPKQVAIGCVVGIGPESGTVERIFFILPACGGVSVPLEDGIMTVQTVMSQAPIARKLIGKELDDEVDARPDQIEPDIILFIT